MSTVKEIKIYVTPEQQAVLDAAVAWREWIRPAFLADSASKSQLALVAAVDAMTRPPSLADRLEEWANTPSKYRGATDDKAAFAALVAKVRELEKRS